MQQKKNEKEKVNSRKNVIYLWGGSGLSLNLNLSKNLMIYGIYAYIIIEESGGKKGRRD